MGVARHFARGLVVLGLTRCWVGCLSTAGCLSLAGLSTACATMGLKSAVDLTVEVAENTPGSALVYVDGQYIGTLAAVAHRGLRLPEGKHRISVEKTGYFPYDTIVVSRVKPIHLEIELLKLPE